MSAKQTIALLRKHALSYGFTHSRAALNDAVSKALYRRRYSSILASERAGKVITPHLDQARAIRVADEYGLMREPFISFLATNVSSEGLLHVYGSLRFDYSLRGFLHRQPAPFSNSGNGPHDFHDHFLELSRDGVVSTSTLFRRMRRGRPGRWRGEKIYIHVDRNTNGQALWNLLVGDAQPLIQTILSSFPVDPVSMETKAPAFIAYRQLTKRIRDLPRDNAIHVFEWMRRRSIRELWPHGMLLEDAIEAIRTALPAWDGTARESPCFKHSSVEDVTDALMKRVIRAQRSEVDRWHARYALKTGHYAVEKYADVVCLDPGSNLEAEAVLDAQVPLGLELYLDFRGITERQRRAASLAIDAHLKRLGVPAIRLVIASAVSRKGGVAYQPDIDALNDLFEIAVAAALPDASMRRRGLSLSWDFAPSHLR